MGRSSSRGTSGRLSKPPLRASFRPTATRGPGRRGWSGSSTGCSRGRSSCSRPLTATGSSAWRAWQERIESRQKFYRDGVAELDSIADEKFGARFIDLDDDQQDSVLETISKKEKPAKFVFADSDGQGSGGAPAGNQPVNEDFLEFFPLLVLNTRQGFYGDPVYGGNDNRVGWRVIGFPGPPSLASTMDGSYTTLEYMIPEAEWPYEQHPAVLRYGNR